jgi:EF-P beta-lysylation protein EpmB
LPVDEEYVSVSAFSSDPVGDGACRIGQKLLSKYQGRVLLLATSACAMHCRFCFRQLFDYDVTDKLFEDELQIIAEDPSINEVILSGGDPLSLDNKILGSLIERIAFIPHVRKLRFHTRFPIGIPERIDEGFLEILANCPLQVWFALHVNHSTELDADILKAMKSIQRLGIPVITQTVLLQGVNDDVDTLVGLCSDLVDNGIMPYYLHQLDRVEGSAHFEVPEECGKQLITEMARRLPGYAVPRYVREIPGMPNKTFI